MNNIETQPKIEVIPLGGVEEIGVNCTVVKYGNSLIVIDVGLGFSDVDHLGVDYLIPNFSYLQERKSQIQGIFITHGHLDHIGAIAQAMKALDFPPIYCSPFAAELIKHRLEEGGVLGQSRINLISADAKLESGDIKVEFFRVNHSIPESMGMIVRTPAGTLVHTGDFKFDNSPLNEPGADLLKMAKAGEEGVKILLSDSTNSFRPGHSISELDIMGRLEEVVRAAQGRVIVATFASLVTRLYALVEIAKKLDRKIYISGRSMEQSIAVARKLNYIKATDDVFVNSRTVNRFSPNRVMILATGSQGETMAALSRMSRGEHRDITIKKGDTVILSSSVIPGNDVLVQTLIDELSQRGAKIINQDIMNLHTSGHGFIEDQKLMLSLFKPEIFMPVHGYQYFLRRHGETAISTGVKPQNVIIAKRGEIVEVSRSGWKINGRVKHVLTLVSGGGVGDVGPLLLEERQQLAANGVLSVNLIYWKRRDAYELAKAPRIHSSGFVFLKANGRLIAQLEERTNKFISGERPLNRADLEQIAAKLRRQLKNEVYNLTGRDPLLLINIEELSA